MSDDGDRGAPVAALAVGPGVAPIIQARQMRDRHTRRFVPSETQAANVKRTADARAEWGVADGSLCFYRSTKLRQILRHRSGVDEEIYEFATKGMLEVDWSEIVALQWKLRGELWQRRRSRS